MSYINIKSASSIYSVVLALYSAIKIKYIELYSVYPTKCYFKISVWLGSDVIGFFCNYTSWECSTNVRGQNSDT